MSDNITPSAVFDTYTKFVHFAHVDPKAAVDLIGRNPTLVTNMQGIDPSQLPGKARKLRKKKTTTTKMSKTRGLEVLDRANNNLMDPSDFHQRQLPISAPSADKFPLRSEEDAVQGMKAFKEAERNGALNYSRNLNELAKFCRNVQRWRKPFGDLITFVQDHLGMGKTQFYKYVKAADLYDKYPRLLLLANPSLEGLMELRKAFEVVVAKDPERRERWQAFHSPGRKTDSLSCTLIQKEHIQLHLEKSTLDPMITVHYSDDDNGEEDEENSEVGSDDSNGESDVGGVSDQLASYHV